MPAYPAAPDLAAIIRDHTRRIKALEVQMANLTGGTPGGSPGSTFDANVLWNGSFESGAIDWTVGYWTGTSGHMFTENANPLAGLHSARVDESANSATQAWWRPTGGSVAGQDVFATTPGEQWQLKATVRSTQPIVNARLVGVCGTIESDCYGIFGNQSYVSASALSLPGGPTITQMSGIVTVPASRNFITFVFRMGVDDTPPPAVPWSWWLDECVLQRKLS